ncbi:MAG: class E sortase [Microlunatus sp.]|nr:class E sortase [Microlunatus sp.]MDN5769472.1 class E sortase [Microlunatus sp.]
MTQSLMDDLADPDEPSVRLRPRRPWSALTVVGLLLLLAGLGCLGWVGWQYFGTNVTSEKAFQEETSQLREKWSQPGDESDGEGSAGSAKEGKGKSQVEKAVIPGDAIALLRIPAFGSDYQVPILSGTDLSILDRGVGHYTTTASPGEIGNFAVAGHRVTHGQPFARLLELDSGDQIVVETRDKIYTYVVDDSPRNLTVNDTQTWVLDPVPKRPGAEATEALMTLTTCQDLFHSPDRSVGFAHLAETVDKG